LSTIESFLFRVSSKYSVVGVHTCFLCIDCCLWSKHTVSLGINLTEIFLSKAPIRPSYSSQSTAGPLSHLYRTHSLLTKYKSCFTIASIFINSVRLLIPTFLPPSQTSRSHVVSKELGPQENGTQQKCKEKQVKFGLFEQVRCIKKSLKKSHRPNVLRESDAWMRIAFRKRNLIVWPYFLVRVFPFSVARINSSSQAATAASAFLPTYGT